MSPKYKITAEYTDHKSHKTKNINFTLVNRFDDFNELISVIQSMNAN